jgi:Transposase
LSEREPVQQCDAGASGTPNCCLTRARTPDSLEKRLLLATKREHGRRQKGRETDVERIIERCAGLDVHKASVTACVRILDEDGALHQEIREFPTTTGGLLLLRDWLASFEVGLVGMEATGVYWKPIYYMLEDDFELWLLNARHLKGTSLRQEDRRKGRRVDLPACGARAGAPQLRAA